MVASESVAELPAGIAVNNQLKLRVSPSGSSDADPSSVTLVPTGVEASGPASATGTRFSVVIITSSAMEFRLPSLTINSAI